MRKKRLVLFVATTLLVFGGGLIAVGLTTPRSLTHDLTDRDNNASRTAVRWRARIGELVLPLLYEGRTEYATGFDPDRFSRLSQGATQSDVRAAIGEPLRIKSFADSITVWYYSRAADKSKTYYVRAVEFDNNGRVTRTLRGYNVD